MSRKFKDKDLLWLLYEVIDSFPIGLPLGNFPSQYLANFYLSGFCHWIKEIKKVKDILVYMDDMVILGDNKEELWKLFYEIKGYMKVNLKLEIKSNYRIFPISEGVDFVGYRHFTTHTLLRKRIKQKMKSKLKKDNKYDSTRYYSWTKPGNCRNLERKYKINPHESKKEGICQAIQPSL